MLRRVLITGAGVAACTVAAALAGHGCASDEFVSETTTSSGQGATGGAGGGGQAGSTSVIGGGGIGGAIGGGGSGGTPCFDVDMDGITDCEGDCDDGDPTSFPGATETCGDNVDNDCDGTPDQMSVCQGLGTYVSQLVGNDANPGTQASPVQTIHQGMLNAVTLGKIQPVFVAEGQYQEKVTMVEAVSLLGGYQCDGNMCTWARDPSMYIATIVNIDRLGVFADIGVTSVTLFDGFTVNGLATNGDGSGAAPGTAAITLAGGTPLVSNNVFQAGAETNCFNNCGSTAVRVWGPTNDPANGSRIENNVVEGGSSNQGCSAIALERNPSPIAKIIGNVVHGGDCPYTRAINAFEAGFGTVVQGNDIFAGNCVGSGFRTTFGMVISGYITVDGNRINADPAQTGSCTSPSFWCGGIESVGATAVITNNVIFGAPTTGKRAAIFMGDGEVPLGAIIVNGNTLDGGYPTPQVNATVSTAMACRTNQGVAAQVGKIRNNILLGGMGTNRFSFYEDDQSSGRTCQPVAYENNDLFNVDNAHRRWLATGMQQLLPLPADVNMMPYAAANFGSDPLLDATSHLMGGSPCIDAGVATEAPLLDIDGDTRPMGAAVDVGADEI
jgi:putative metal-binding protein